MYDLLKNIQSPADLKKFSLEEMKNLAEEIRQALIFRVSHCWGHFGPNLGMVETEIALHYVFNSPKDKFVFDVSHQTYPHKMLTWRAVAYIDPAHFHDVSWYTDPKENEHDFFTVGHTSTSISLASWLAKARDSKGEKENIIAIIGDGSLSGGEALEGLDFVWGEMHSNFIIIVNDNEQSIAENHGGLYQNLKLLRETNGQAELNLFKAMELDYRYEDEGNNLENLINLFQSIKDIDHPIVLHIHTQKGKGYVLAETQKEARHWHLPFNPETWETSISFWAQESYESLTSQLFLKKIGEDPTFTVVTAAMPGSLGFDQEKREKAWLQFIDVWIAEEHAIAMVSGIAKNGGKVVFGTNASFLQRTYDQMSQDLCLNENPVTILVNYSSVWGLNDATHLGIFNYSLFSNIPNLVLLAPTSKQEYLAMLNWSLEQRNHPVMIMIPWNGVIDDNREIPTTFDNLNTFKIEEQGEKLAILALGDFYQIGEKVAQKIKEKIWFIPTLINPRFASGLDVSLLEHLKQEHQIVITLEDGILEGGFWQKVASFYGPTDMKVKNYGLEKKFYDRYDANELLDQLGITPEKICHDIETMLK